MTQAREVVTDANVLINLLHAGRLDLLAALPHLRFLVVDEGVAELARPEHQAALQQALQAGCLHQVSLTDPVVLTLYGELKGLMQIGEAASLALACTTGAFVASDERRAFLPDALARLVQARLLTTPGLLLLAIRRGVLTVPEADAIKSHLETCRFKMTFASFQDLLPGPAPDEPPDDVF